MVEGLGLGNYEFRFSGTWGRRITGVQKRDP